MISRVKAEWLVYSAVALVVMWSMLRPGYVLTLDMVFTPHMRSAVGVGNGYVWQELLHWLSLAVSGQVVEKLVIFAVLVLCGVSMYRLLDTRGAAAQYFGGLFYMINPFTYERWMAGQYLVVAGYALLPFVVKSLMELGRRPGWQTALRTALWYTAIALLSLHNLVLAGLLGVLICGSYLWRPPRKAAARYRQTLGREVSLLLGAGILLNSYWLAGVVNGSSTITQAVSSVGAADLQAFATASNPHAGLLFNVLSLYGFWGERDTRYAMPNHNLYLWIIGFGLLAILIALGVRAAWRRRSRLGLVLAVAAGSGLVMALGIHGPLTGGLVKWLLTQVPLLSGFRDSEKFSALLVLAYAYFAAWGLDAILARLQRPGALWHEVAQDGALLLPALYTITMPFGFGDQLQPVQYPASWYAFNRQLQQHPVQGKLLFLPWHEYMSYDFTNRIIANPTPAFFAAPVIAGTDAEFDGRRDPHPTATSRFIEQQVLAHASQTDLGLSLNHLHVHYILLADGYDYAQYGWLNHQTDLRLVSRQPGLTVYQNEAYHG